MHTQRHTRQHKIENYVMNSSSFSQRVLPPLRHAYIIPFVPSGFWPRLMSRVLSDKTIIQLAREGCNIEEDGEGVTE